MMRGERENFFSREKKPNVGFVILFPCPAIALATADLTLSRKAENFFIYFYLSLSGTEPNRKRLLLTRLKVLQQPALPSHFRKGGVLIQLLFGIVPIFVKTFRNR